MKEYLKKRLEYADQQYTAAREQCGDGDEERKMEAHHAAVLALFFVKRPPDYCLLQMERADSESDFYGMQKSLAGERPREGLDEKMGPGTEKLLELSRPTFAYKERHYRRVSEVWGALMERFLKGSSD